MKYRFSLLITLLLLISNVMSAQIGRWLITPKYEKIRVDNIMHLVYGTLADTTFVWNMKGRLLFKTTDKVYQFKENRAVSVKPGTTDITGFYFIDGTFTALNNCRIAHSYPYFSNGLLLTETNGGYKYVNGDGTDFSRLLNDAYPFFNNYCSCAPYENYQKNKNPYLTYLNSESVETTFSFQGKTFDKDEIEFVSSISDDGKGVVLIKSILYFFNANNNSLTPILGNTKKAQEQKQVYIDGKFEECYTATSDSTSALMAQISKKEIVLFNFDRLLRPVSIVFSDKKVSFPTKEEQNPVLKTESVVFKGDNGLYGVNIQNIEVFPPQFEQVKPYEGKMIIVKTKEGWGMIEIDESQNFRIRINKGNAIGFRHQKYETNIRIDLPTYISANNTRLYVADGKGCTIDNTSCEMKNTESGNYVQYNCTLDIPANLPDEVTDVDYPVQVRYEGLLSPVLPVKSKAWYIKYYNVDIDNPETTISDGVVSFSFGIIVEKKSGEEDFPLTVTADAHPSDLYLEKITEMKYKCHVSSLEEGVNELKIKVNEKGCPESVFPLEIVYSINKGKGKTAGKAQAIVRKKIVTSLIEGFQQ